MVKRRTNGTDGFVAAPPDDLCLTYANTLYWRGSQTPTEELHALADVLSWAGKVGGVDPATIGRFGTFWDAHPRAAAPAFAAAIDLRETLYRIFAALASGRNPPVEDLARLNAALQAAPARTRLRQENGAFVWDLEVTEPAIPALLAPVLWSAADLVAGPRRPRVRRCGNDRCLYLFLDDSKSGNRRWCSMSSCGNRAKAHRHYVKHRSRGPAPPGDGT